MMQRELGLRGYKSLTGSSQRQITGPCEQAEESCLQHQTLEATDSSDEMEIERDTDCKSVAEEEDTGNDIQMVGSRKRKGDVIGTIEPHITVAQGSITMTVDTASKWMKALKGQKDKNKFLLQFADSAKISVERLINKEEPFRADQTVGYGYCLYASALRARMYASGGAPGNYQTVEEEIAAVKQFAKEHWGTFEAKLTERKYETATIERWRKEIQDMVESFGTHQPYPPSDLMQEWDYHP